MLKAAAKMREEEQAQARAAATAAATRATTLLMDDLVVESLSATPLEVYVLPCLLLKDWLGRHPSHFCMHWVMMCQTQARHRHCQVQREKHRGGCVHSLPRALFPLEAVAIACVCVCVCVCVRVSICCGVPA
jgi:hypothetical protein